MFFSVPINLVKKIPPAYHKTAAKENLLFEYLSCPCGGVLHEMWALVNTDEFSETLEVVVVEMSDGSSMKVVSVLWHLLKK